MDRQLVLCLASENIFSRVGFYSKLKKPLMQWSYTSFSYIDVTFKVSFSFYCCLYCRCLTLPFLLSVVSLFNVVFCTFLSFTFFYYSVLSNLSSFTHL